MAKDKAKVKAEDNGDIADRYEKDAREELLKLLKKKEGQECHNPGREEAKPLEEKIHRLYKKLACQKCKIKDCVNHPKTNYPDGMKKLTDEQREDLYGQDGAPYLCLVGPFIDIKLDGMDTASYYDQLMDYIHDMKEDKKDKKPSATLKHLKAVRELLKDSADYQSGEMVTLRPLIKAVKFLLSKRLAKR